MYQNNKEAVEQQADISNSKWQRLFPAIQKVVDHNEHLGVEPVQGSDHYLLYQVKVQKQQKWGQIIIFFISK